MLSDFTDAIDERSARGIAASIGRMITDSTLALDSRLPTVRALSKALGVSPTTVSEAWQTLAAVGAIEARGRLLARAREPGVNEVLLALNATVEGQSTAHYIAEQLAGTSVKISRLAVGVPVGGELDYLDDGTLATAIRGRR